MRRTLALLPALALLLLAACQVEERPATTTDVTTADHTMMAEEFRTDMTSRLNDIQSDIAEIEQRVQDPAYPGDRDDLVNRARELRDEHASIQRRLTEFGTTATGTTTAPGTTADPATGTTATGTTTGRDNVLADDAFRSDHEGILRDVQGLELRTERALIVAGRTVDEVRSTVEDRMGRIDDHSGRWTTTATDWRRDAQDHRARVERELAELQTVPAGNFESARQDVEQAYADYRDRVYAAERDHYDTTYAHTGTTTGTTAY